MLIFNIIDTQPFQGSLSPVLCPAFEADEPWVPNTASDNSGGVWWIVRRDANGHPSIVSLKERGAYGLKGRTYPVRHAGHI